MYYIPEKEEIIRKNNWTTDNGDKLNIFGSGSSYHGFIVKEDHTLCDLYGFGCNDNSQLGLGDFKNRTQLTLIPFFKSKKITKVSCGYDHSIFLLKNEIYCCGSNDKGQIGFNDKKKRETPTLLRITQNNQTVVILDVFVGNSHSHVLSSLFEVYSFGKNVEGQLGVGDNKDKRTATKVQFSEKIISVSSGGFYSYFISINGNLYFTGENKYSQFGDNSKTGVNIPKKLLFFKKKKIIQVCCGERFTFYLTSDNQVYGTGRNDFGELGIGNFIDQKTPVLVSNLKNEKIIRVKCGSDHTCFASKKKIWMTGYNFNGPIGNGSCENVNSPVLFSIKGKKIVQSLMLYLSSIHFTKNEVYGAGYNGYGELFCGKTNGLTGSGNNPTPFKIRDLVVQKRKIGINTKLEEERERFEFLMSDNKKFVECTL